MKKVFSNPHIYFFALIPIVLVLGFIYKEEAIDINISYANFLISYSTLSYVFCVFFGLIGLNYFSIHWAQKKMIGWLTITHIVLQTLALFLFFTKNKWNWVFSKEYPSEIGIQSDYSNLILILSLFIFIISAFIHLINFFVSLISKTK